MWRIENNRLIPVMTGATNGTPWHSSPYCTLPEIYVQNASLEIAFCRLVFEEQTIAGKRILPFLTKEREGFDINLPEDWCQAENLINQGDAKLPEIKMARYRDGKWAA